jgi:hypothetical protein
MAPEQAQRQPPTEARDVVAFGLIRYEMATGRRARGDGNILAMLRQIDHEDQTEYATQAPEPFVGILGQALLVDPTRRTIRMAQIAEQLAE